MIELMKLKIENDPIIANELVKFLSLNNDNESVKKLEKDHLNIKQELKATQKDIKEGLKSMYK